jgi:hypothetical protein
MGVPQQSSLTSFSVYPYAVLLDLARRKEQRRAVHEATTLSRKHGPGQLVVNLGYPNPREMGRELIDAGPRKMGIVAIRT